MFPSFKQMFSIVPTWMKVVWVIGALISIVGGGTLLYVTAHFVMKFW